MFTIFFHFPNYYFGITFVMFLGIAWKSFYQQINFCWGSYMSFECGMGFLISVSPNLSSCFLVSCRHCITPFSKQIGLLYVLSFMLSCCSSLITVSKQTILLNILDFFWSLLFSPFLWFFFPWQLKRFYSILVLIG